MKTFVIGLFAVVAASVSLASSAQAQNSPAQYYNKYIPTLSLADQKAQSMNNRGLQYCLSQQGKVVGKGYSEDLAIMHLAASGAIPPDFRDRRNYVWGAVPNGWAPGDVLQFEQCYFEWQEGNRKFAIHMEHHTAIIASIQKDSVVELVHQKGPNGAVVVVEKLDLKTKQRGTIRGWRPVGSN